MTRTPADAGRDRRFGRRELLALSGALGLTSLTGCLDQLPGSGPDTLDGDAVAVAVTDEAPEISETLPVDIATSFVAEQREVAREKLDSVPAPFDESEIPNGVIREQVNGEYRAAREAIRESADDGTAYERLGRATRSRESAQEVVLAWRAIEGEATVEDLRESRSAADDAVDALASRWEYVGDDPVRAAVVHAEIEREVRAARNWLSFGERELEYAAEQPLEFADVAVDIERARTSEAVASYYFERFRGDLAREEPLRERFATARDSLDERVRTRGESLPEETDDPTTLVDREITQTAGVIALSDVLRNARWRVEDRSGERDPPSLASDALLAAETLVYLRAFEALRERIEEGDDVAVDEADDVAALRGDAVDAITSAREADRNRFVVDAILPRFARELRWIDDRLSGYEGDTRVDFVEREAAEYVVVAETCRAVPPVSADVAATLRGDSGS
ncbi:hypothetical protein [Halobellus rufus]|uniref:hypothetical protein n=1 Tax=Halobellus rufus TaxID=1448860 RepID=UPI000678E312|nr:hypothetical protein [Halobellus rufus]